MSEPCEKCLSLEKLQDERWEGHRREHDLIEKATEAARLRMEDRLHGMNDLKAQVDSERGTFLKVSDFNREHKVLADKVDSIRGYMFMVFGGVTVISWLAQGIFFLVERMR